MEARLHILHVRRVQLLVLFLVLNLQVLILLPHVPDQSHNILCHVLRSETVKEKRSKKRSTITGKVRFMKGWEERA
jgi:hypothetical protein